MGELVVLNPETRRVTTSSLTVAEVFGKEHFNVIQSIQTLDCSDEFLELNFQVYSYKPEGAKRSYPAYEITRDGFTFLAMGFTGAKAAEFKERYIQAFNEMERKLVQPQVPQLSRIELLQMALEAEQKLIEVKPKVEAYDCSVVFRASNFRLTSYNEE